MPKIDKGTGVSIGVVVIILFAFAGFFTMMSAKADDKDLDKVRTELEEAEDKIVEREKRDIEHMGLIKEVQTANKALQQAQTTANQAFLDSIIRLNEKIDRKHP